MGLLSPRVRELLAARAPHPSLSGEAQAEIINTTASFFAIPADFLAAIRIAENGRPGREFGVLSVTANSYYGQAATAALSIAHNVLRYWNEEHVDAFEGETPTPGFVEFFASRWAPQGVENDPHHLNANWVANVINVTGIV